MKQYEIIYTNSTEQCDSIFFDKGYRDDVVVIINDRKYQLYITDLIRLSQDFQSEVLEYGYYQIQPNIIIVKKVTKNDIETTINKLINSNFFEQLGCCQLLSEKQMIINDVQIEFNHNVDNWNKEIIISGYRKDVQVIIKNKRYNLYIVTLVRLFQDLVRDDVLNSFKYLNHPNLVIVDNFNEYEITTTIKKLYNSEYFDKLGYI